MNIAPSSWLTFVRSVLLGCLLVLADGFNFQFSQASELTKSADKQTELPYLRVGLDTKALLEGRGYRAKDHQIVVDDGYVLGLTSAYNPLIGHDVRRARGLKPVLLVHGTAVNANVYMVNSLGARAKNLLDLVDPRQLDIGSLIHLLEHEPSINSLAMLLLNFGYECWFLHRRGTAPSLERRFYHLKEGSLTPYEKLQRAYRLAYDEGRLSPEETNEQLLEQVNEEDSHGADSIEDISADTELLGLPKEATNASALLDDKLRQLRKNNKFFDAIKGALPHKDSLGRLLKDIKTSFDSRLWNFSLDEQAAYDIPRAVEYVLQQTESNQCIFVGNSASGGLGLMALILNPELNKQLSKVILLSPAFNMGHGSNKMLQVWKKKPPSLCCYTGPFPWTFISVRMQVLYSILCSVELMQDTLCQMMAASSSGPTGGQMPFRGEFFHTWGSPVSAFEYFQYFQQLIYKSTRFFHYGKKKNAILYGGKEEPPIYDARLITNEHLSFWSSRYDTMIVDKDQRLLFEQLRGKLAEVVFCSCFNRIHWAANSEVELVKACLMLSEY